MHALVVYSMKVKNGLQLSCKGLISSIKKETGSRKSHTFTKNSQGTSQEDFTLIHLYQE